MVAVESIQTEHIELFISFGSLSTLSIGKVGDIVKSGWKFMLKILTISYLSGNM